MASYTAPIDEPFLVKALRNETRNQLKNLLMKEAENVVNEIVDSAIKELQINANTYLNPIKREQIVQYVITRK